MKPVGKPDAGKLHVRFDERGEETERIYASPRLSSTLLKRGKTDAADAEAVCEAVTRPTMRFVPVKSPEQQAALSMHRTRDLLVKQRTQLVNMIRGLLAEFGIDIPKGLERALLKARQIVDGDAPDVPIEATKIVGTLSQQALDLHVRLRQIDRDLLVWQRGNDVARRLMTIPGIGPVGATALAASVTDPHQFRSGRQFAAWLGLTPLQKSSGGKERLGQQDGRQVPAQAAHCWHDLTCTPCKIQSR